MNRKTGMMDNRLDCELFAHITFFLLFFLLFLIESLRAVFIQSFYFNF